MGCQLGSGVIVVRPHGKTRRNARNMDLPYRHFCRSYPHCALDSAGIGREANLAGGLLRRLCTRQRHTDGARANLVGTIHLGCLWSSAITRKEKHRLVDTGPYAFVRHPIYTGLIIALLATAAIEATLAALLGALLIALGLWVKARAEERFLSTELGPETYEFYRCRVPMLVPFIPHR